MATRYGKWFYRRVAEDSWPHVGPIVSAVLDLFRPLSVVDVGCGAGHFLAEFLAHGIDDVVGVDFPGVPVDLLRIPADRFVGFDLSKSFSLDRRFDLVVSLEVAEHIAPASADVFVNTLVAMGPVVVFSAAIPLQGGYRHVNEQWPDYWVAKFLARNFTVIDGLRDRLWQNDDVPCYYRQNILIFVDERELHRYPRLQAEGLRTHRQSLSRVHPSLYEQRSDPRRVSLRFLLRGILSVPAAFFRAVRSRVRTRFGV